MTEHNDLHQIDMLINKYISIDYTFLDFALQPETGPHVTRNVQPS